MINVQQLGISVKKEHLVAILQSHIDTSAAWFDENRRDMLEQISIIQDLHDEAAAGGGQVAMDRMRSREKMPIRERISLVLDPDSPFFEISSLAGYCSKYSVGGGLVMGIGVINGVECMIEGNDPTVLGGAITSFAAVTFEVMMIHKDRCLNKRTTSPNLGVFSTT